MGECHWQTSLKAKEVCLHDKTDFNLQQSPQDKAHCPHFLKRMLSMLLNLFVTPVSNPTSPGDPSVPLPPSSTIPLDVNFCPI